MMFFTLCLVGFFVFLLVCCHTVKLELNYRQSVTDETFIQFTGGTSNSCLNNNLSIGNTIGENNGLSIIRRLSYYDFD